MPYKDPKSERAVISNKKRRAKYYAKPESKEVIKRNHLRKRFGISLDAYRILFESQNGLCAVCMRPETAKNQYTTKSLSVDHDHATGKVRGLLCNGCNTALGFLKEDIAVMKMLILYVKKHQNG